MMIKLKEILTEDKVPRLSPQECDDKKLWGPVFHGTTESNRREIETQGFKIFHGKERSEQIANGYETSDYSGGIPAPIHHLGYGVYFTTSKTIAKKYNHGTTRGLKVYYLDAHRKEEINFGSPNTMMKWWIKNGYDYNPNNLPELYFGSGQTNLKAIAEERVRATLNLTKELSSNYDVVWYKGKGMYRLLDGDQVCVYDPKHIYEMDVKLAKRGERGSKVAAAVNIDRYNRGEITVSMGTKGIILKREDADEFRKKYPMAKWVEDSKYLYTVKWERGGEMSQLLDKWITIL